MTAPSPTWETTYRHDRRAARHRCRCCSKILNEGEPVLMVKLHKKSWALHISCADKANSTAGWTWRDSFEAWGIDHIRSLGWTKLQRHPMTVTGAVKQ